MKDISNLKNYRLKYKRYYGIDFDNNFIVHHIDFNRQNNKIENLLLLPKELHQKYHFYLNALFPLEWKSGNGVIDIKINQYSPLPYCNIKMLQDFLKVLEECKKWVEYKSNLEIRRKFKNGV